MAGVHLLTFSSRGYSKPERFLSQAHATEFFETIEVYSNEQIFDLIRKRPFQFLFWRKKGFGFWIWKPRVIIERLQKLHENDFLVYLDQGFHLQKSGAETLDRYLDEVRQSKSWAGVFSAGEIYRPESFVRQKSVIRHHPKFYDGGFGEYIYAGVLIIRNTIAARGALLEWQKMCEETPIWAPLNFRLGEKREFMGQDGDNGYLPVVLDKHGGYIKFPIGEVNLHNSEGVQLQHVLPKADWANIDWGPLAGKPFLLKRDV